MRAAIFPIVILIAGAIGSFRPARAETVHCGVLQKVLPVFQPFQLSDDPHCRARWITDVGDSRHAMVCLSEELTRRWLSSPNASLCGEIAGRWKVSASLLEDETENKPIQKRFYLSALARNDGAGVVSRETDLIGRRLLRERLSFSDRLSRIDPDGLLRFLFLHEFVGKSPLSFLKLIGLSHVVFSPLYVYLLWVTLAFLSREICRITRLPSWLGMVCYRIAAVSFMLWAFPLNGESAAVLSLFVPFGMKRLGRRQGVRWSAVAIFIFLLIVILLRRFDSGPWWMPLSFLLGMRLILSALPEKNAFPFQRSVVLALGGFLLSSVCEVFEHHLFSLATPIFSLILIPWIGGVLFPWFLMTSCLHIQSGAMDGCLTGALNLILHQLEAWTLKFQLLIHLTPFALLSAALLVSIAVVFFKTCPAMRTPLRAFASASLLFIWLIRVSSAGAENPLPQLRAKDVIQLDVGQGDAALVFGERNGLIDAGSEKKLSDAQWLTRLAKADVTSLDFVFLTHLDEDHRGGLVHLARVVQVGCVSTSDQALHSDRGEALSRALNAHEIRFLGLESGCIPYPTLEPPAGRRRKNQNADMSSILIPLKSGDFYFSAGDAEGADETRAAQWADQEIEKIARDGLRIMKISHHGSKTSSEPATFRIFHPDAAVISAGIGNPYGHPAPEVLERIERLRIPLFRTDRDGPFRAEAFLRQRQEHHP